MELSSTSCRELPSQQTCVSGLDDAPPGLYGSVEPLALRVMRAHLNDRAPVVPVYGELLAAEVYQVLPEGISVQGIFVPVLVSFKPAKFSWHSSSSK